MTPDQTCFLHSANLGGHSRTTNRERAANDLMS